MHKFIFKLARLFLNKKKRTPSFTKDIFSLRLYEIGDYTYGEPKVLYANPDSPEDSNIQGHPATKGSVIIGNNVWLGRHSTIMSDVNIGNGAVVGAHSVATRSIGPYEIWAGNPAKLIGRRFDAETISKIEEIQWWNWDILKIRRYQNTVCSRCFQTT